MNRADNTLLRVGVFYDGTYFAHVSNYYLYQHERKARLSIEGIHEFVRDEVSRHEGVDKRFCQIVDAHYFRGRLNAKQAQENDSLYRERQFDDVLIREGVTMHFLPVVTDRSGDIGEKGIDVWFALEAYELAVHKRFDISVIVSGDGDFVPLVRKLNTLGTRVMLLAWDFDSEKNGDVRHTRTSQALINEVTYPVMMSDEIDSRGRKKDPAITRLFVQRAKELNHEPAVSTQGGSTPQTGTIVSFNDEKGYGFIRPDGGGDNLFFHVSGTTGVAQEDLISGEAVSFYPTKGDRGMVASQVSLIK